jgi:aminoglycoside phosphotransferase family enzyme
MKHTTYAQAKGLLDKTDWYVIKATDVESYSVPSNITTYRSQVRAKVNSMESDIDDCSTVEELITLLTYTTNDAGVSSRPLGEFPDEVV